MLVISWYITQASVDEACALELVKYMLGAQNADGGWATYHGESTTLMGTILVYVALRLIGLSAEDEQLTKARKRLLDMGGAIYLSGWAKLWLAMLGLYEWKGTDPYPVEMWLLPEWLPVSPWKWFVIPRQVYLSMRYLSAKRFTIPTNPLLDLIREELFVQPYSSLNFSAYRGVTLQCSREQRKSWGLIALNWFIHNIWNPWLRPRRLAVRGEQKAWEIIQETDKVTNSVGGVSVDCFLNMIAFYSKEGSDSKRLRHIQDVSQEYLWLSRQGMQVMSIHAGHTWETAFALQAYAEADLIDEPDLQTSVKQA